MTMIAITNIIITLALVALSRVWQLNLRGLSALVDMFNTPENKNMVWEFVRKYIFCCYKNLPGNIFFCFCMNLRGNIFLLLLWENVAALILCRLFEKIEINTFIHRFYILAAQNSILKYWDDDFLSLYFSNFLQNLPSWEFLKEVGSDTLSKWAFAVDGDQRSN